jgi:hypothetical protein
MKGGICVTSADQPMVRMHTDGVKRAKIETPGLIDILLLDFYNNSILCNIDR